MGSLWATLVWPAQVLLVYVATPAGLADIGTRRGWRKGRPGPWNLFGLILLAPGLLGLGWIAYRHLTSSPRSIEIPQPAPEYLLTDGLYRWSRNPMYVAGIATWIGRTVYYGNLAVMASALAFSSGIALLAAPYEEQALEARFRESYLRYKASVPRWLGLPRRNESAGENSHGHRRSERRFERDNSSDRFVRDDKGIDPLGALRKTTDVA